MAYTLTAEKREISGKKVKSLIEKRQVPAVIYGNGIENTNIQVDGREFEKVYSEAGENQVVELSIAGDKSVDVLIKAIQIDPIKRGFIHADFQAVDVNKAMLVQVPLKFVGEAPAVKSSGGTLVKRLDSLEIKCFPKDLPKFIEVDLASLVGLDDSIAVEDIKVGETLTVLDNGTDMVATVVPPRIETETTETPAEGEVAPAEGEAKPGETKPAEGAEKKEQAK